MLNYLSRTELLIGKDSIEIIKNKKIIVFGAGGVGSFCIEALVRCGVEKITIVDNDTISLTNINRQLIATTKTIGRLKVDVVEERIQDINPNCKVIKKAIFFNKETYDLINLLEYDYVVDAIDTISSKIYLAEFCYNNNIKMISSMGTGNRLDPTKFEINDLYNTSYDPVAKVMRYELKRRGIRKLKVLFSTEIPLKPIQTKDLENDSTKRSIPGSISFVPPVAGMIIAGEVIKDLIK